MGRAVGAASTLRFVGGAVRAIAARTRRWVARVPWLVTGTALLLSACQSADSGPARHAAPAGEPVVQAPPSDANAVPSHGAPKIDHPIDITPMMTRPCDVLTDDEVVGLLGTDTTEKRSDFTGPSCGWGSFGPQAAFVAVGFPTVSNRGLTSIYRAKDAEYKFFKELAPVLGFPTVAFGYFDDTETRGSCHIAAGTSDRTTVDAAVTLSPRNRGTKDPCEAAREVLATALQNIQAATL
ncbi:DUF3558 domain-containing protein [Amycolatopsis magusensis]|uniref:DUF3558 domain-containing protein n=1 Tax=Amycolatopsis magusensis TaxID=882444 RepID=UPI0037B07791